MSGKSPRKDSRAKALGKAKYTDDINIGEFLYGRAVGVPVTCGRLKKINFDKNYDWHGFTICTFKDLAEENLLHPKPSDEPILLEENVEYFGQPTVLLAHHDYLKLREAAKHISFEFEERQSEAVVFSEKTLIIGDTTKGFSESDKIIEGTYSTQAQEHLYLENQIVVAFFDEDLKTLFVEGSMQAPFNVREALIRSFKNRAHEVVITPHLSGGAFGGREDFTTQLALHASLLAVKSGKVVKIKLDRISDLKFSTKRHPSKSQVKVGLKGNKINALELHFTLDGGAFETISGIVLSRSMLHPGSYQVPNLKVNGRAIKTNTPSNGAFRGFGAPQTFFAIESHLDHMIKKFDFDEIDFRRNNLLTANSKSLSGQTMNGVGVNQVFEELINFSHYRELRKEVNEFNKSNSKKKKGLGLANVFHGTGYTGYQDIDTPISVNLKLLPSGQVEIESSVIEFGQGSHTVLPQIAANILKIPIDSISVKNINTQVTPSSGATVASRTTTVLGTLVEKASRKLLEKIGSSEVVTISESYQRGEPFDYDTMQGHAYENYPSAATLSLIEVDLVTYNIKVGKVYMALDAGKVINKSNAEGQVQGGILQGIGYALFEEMIMGEHGYKNNSLSNYTFPTSIEAPEIAINFVQNEAEGPKGLGEIPISGMAPSIANALEDALGIRFRDLPITPEKIEQALQLS